MELEFHQIDLCFEHLRKRKPVMEDRLLASLASVGQQVPIVVLPQDNKDRYALVDGYKRLRALHRLQQDTVKAMIWDLDEVEALLLGQVMRNTESEGPLEQGWLLCELRDRFNIALSELARRFDKTPSWVSRRLALVEALPEQVQEQVRWGRIAAHTAMKVLVPLARANRRDCLRFCEALQKAVFTTREALVLQAGWQQGHPEVRERILADPALFLRTQQALQAEKAQHGPFHLWLDDLTTLSAIARRAKQHLKKGALMNRPPAECKEAHAALRQTAMDCQTLFQAGEKALRHA
jgi:ParB family chromosome partitioning protein